MNIDLTSPDKNKKKFTMIISGFPGVGKSFTFNEIKKTKDDFTVLDSDSSTFDKADFPANYIRHIKENIGVVDIIFVSSHDTVRAALEENRLPFMLVYPKVSLKDEYLARYAKRGSPQAFIDLIARFWETWLKELPLQKGCIHSEIDSNEYIFEALEKFCPENYTR